MIKKLLIAIVVLGLLAGGAAAWKYHQLVEFAGTPGPAPAKEFVVTIPARMGPHGVSEKLASAGVIDDAQLFYWDVRYLRKVQNKLKAGEYLFKAGVAQTPDEIIDRLLKGEVLSVKITVPEGLRIDEQAAIFEQAGLGKPGEFERLARDEKFTRSLGVDGKSLEGYLFPDTYQIPKNATTEAILKLMVERFRKAWAQAEAQRSKSVKLTEKEAVTLASIVEKETGNPEERPRISCVFHNRLKLDMKLQTDPTVIYSVILRTGHFDGNLHRADLDTPHPYNTYAVKGLPPGPISNPGQAALDAALNPITCDDLYFVSKNDGSHVFCPTLKCHEANVQKWQVEYFRKKHANGG